MVVLGVGHLVGFKRGIEGYVAKKRKYREREKVMAIVKEKIAEARVEMKAEYDKDLARAIKEMKSRQENENPESPPMRKSSCDSASNFDVLDNIQVHVLTFFTTQNSFNMQSQTPLNIDSVFDKLVSK